jgi:asparagine N-glycosylation enzyme membrane subunit Stt3
MEQAEHMHQHGNTSSHEHTAPVAAGHGIGALNLDNRLIFAIIVIAILAVTIYARFGLVKAQGLFEPDGFFYYSIVRATLNSHLSEPQHLGISGFPGHNFIGEAPGLPYLTVIFYLLLGWTGATALQVMRLLPVFVAIVEVILAYFLAKELSDSRLCGILAMFFVAVSAGNIARTAALVYRGDTFIGVPLMVALLVMLKGLKHLQAPKRMAVYALIGAFVLSTGALVWNGSPYIIVVYMLSLALLALWSFISWKPDLARAALIFIGALAALYILQSIYLALHAIRPGLSLEGISFLAFYIPLLLGAMLVFWLTKRGRVGVLHSRAGRVGIVVVATVAVLLVLAVTFGSYITTIAEASGVYAPPVPTNINATTISYAIGSTTQELQKPTFSFLFASFGLGLYLAPIGVIMFLLFNSVFDPREKESGRTILTVAFIVMLSYLAITSYLQYNAIRYNSLVSIPIAIFAAYGLYSLMRIYRGHEDWAKRFASTSFVLAIAACMFYLAALLITNWHNGGGLKWLLEGTAGVLVAIFIVVDTASRLMRRQQVGRMSFTISVALLCGYLLLRAYQLVSLGSSSNTILLVVEGVLIGVVAVGALADTGLRIWKKEISLRTVALAIFVAVVVFSAIFTIVESYASTQADGINPSFLSAMAWMKNNTATNATVLALWPDGSVVEGWANRTSYMDSVGGENGIRIYYFANYLINNTPDSQYLYSIGKPQYLVARQYWLTELTGLVAEGVPQNPSNYTYTVLQTIGQPRQNSTAQLYYFGNGYYNITLVNKLGNLTHPNYTAYLGAVGSPRQYRINRVTLYNTSSTRYLEFPAPAGSYQLNYTLMIFYSGSVIQGALITTDGLYSSNLFRLVWLCNQYECPYSNSTARISPVYFNNDTRIYRITYT